MKSITLDTAEIGQLCTNGSTPEIYVVSFTNAKHAGGSIVLQNIDTLEYFNKPPDTHVYPATLKDCVTNAKSEQELKALVESLPRQENGFRGPLASILEDCFWYVDLDTLQKQIDWMLIRINWNTKKK